VSLFCHASSLLDLGVSDGKQELLERHFMDPRQWPVALCCFLKDRMLVVLEGQLYGAEEIVSWNIERSLMHLNSIVRGEGHYLSDSDKRHATNRL